MVLTAPSDAGDTLTGNTNRTGFEDSARMVGNTEVIRLAKANLEGRKDCFGNRTRMGRRLRRLSLQSRWFISLGMRVRSAKRDASGLVGYLSAPLAANFLIARDPDTNTLQRGNSALTLTFKKRN
jgi:hypothetical protein